MPWIYRNLSVRGYWQDSEFRMYVFLLLILILVPILRARLDSRKRESWLALIPF